MNYDTPGILFTKPCPVSPRKKILIIDDETDFCLLFKNYLQKKGCDAFVANSLTEGFQLMNEIKPDILFLDNNLPDGFGWEKAEVISKEFPAIKINLISAYNHNFTHADSAHIKIWEKPLDRNLLDSYFQHNIPSA